MEPKQQPSAAVATNSSFETCSRALKWKDTIAEEGKDSYR